MVLICLGWMMGIVIIVKIAIAEQIQANEIAKTSEVEIYVEIHINAGGGTWSRGMRYWKIRSG